MSSNDSIRSKSNDLITMQSDLDLKDIDELISGMRKIDNKQFTNDFLVSTLKLSIKSLESLNEAEYKGVKAYKLLLLQCHILFYSAKTAMIGSEVVSVILNSKLHSIYRTILYLHLNSPTDQQQDEKKSNSTISRIFDLLNNSASLSEKVALQNAKYDFIHAGIQCLANNKLSVMPTNSPSTYESIIRFLLTNSHYRSLRKEFIKVDAAKVLLDEKNRIDSEIRKDNDRLDDLRFTKTELIALLTYILTDPQLDMATVAQSMVESLIITLRDTIEQSKKNQTSVDNTRFYLVYGATFNICINASTVLSELFRISENDTVKQKVYDNGGIPLLLKFLDEGNNEEQEWSSELLCSLCFNESVRKIIKMNTNFYEMISKKIVTSDNTEIVDFCKQIIHMIDEKLSSRPSRAAYTGNNFVNKHVMISYNWKSKAQCLNIKDALKKRGYKTWIAAENQTNNFLDDMASAVENSHVVLICYNYDYKTAPFNRYEAEYVFQNKKKIIPIRMESNYEPDGWLAKVLQNNVTIDSTSTDDFNTSMLTLYEKLNSAFQEPTSALSQTKEREKTVIINTLNLKTTPELSQTPLSIHTQNSSLSSSRETPRANKTENQSSFDDYNTKIHQTPRIEKDGFRNSTSRVYIVESVSNSKNEMPKLSTSSTQTGDETPRATNMLRQTTATKITQTGEIKSNETPGTKDVLRQSTAVLRTDKDNSRTNTSGVHIIENNSMFRNEVSKTSTMSTQTGEISRQNTGILKIDKDGSGKNNSNVYIVENNSNFKIQTPRTSTSSTQTGETKVYETPRQNNGILKIDKDGSRTNNNSNVYIVENISYSRTEAPKISTSSTQTGEVKSYNTPRTTDLPRQNTGILKDGTRTNVSNVYIVENNSYSKMDTPKSSTKITQTGETRTHHSKIIDPEIPRLRRVPDFPKSKTLELSKTKAAETQTNTDDILSSRLNRSASLKTRSISTETLAHKATQKDDEGAKFKAPSIEAFTQFTQSNNLLKQSKPVIEAPLNRIPIEKWSSENVKMWLIQNDLNEFIIPFEHLDGSSLITLVEMKIRFYEKFCNLVDKLILKGKYEIPIHKQLKLYRCIESLREVSS